jgi:hypothetical protein
MLCPACSVLATAAAAAVEAAKPRELSAADQLAALVAVATRADVAASISTPKAWVQPQGAHDAYPPGAVVLAPGGHRWRNDLPGFNVWPLAEPAAHWTDLDAVVAVGPQPWKQPVGSTDAYAKGAVVTYGGKTWTSTVAANVWAPGTGTLWTAAP